MVSQRAPEVQKWPPKVLPRCPSEFPDCQKGGTNPPDGNPEKPKGAGGRRRSVVLKIIGIAT